MSSNRKSHIRAVGMVAAVLTLTMISAAAPVGAAAPYPNQQPVAGDAFTHDPSMVVRPGTPRYVVYSTKARSLVSEDRVVWGSTGQWFSGENPPGWTASFGELWAPDASFHDGRYWLYYSVSTLGSQHSAIGVATSPTGLPGSFADHGLVLSSEPGDPYNAIDPALFVGDDGKWWLAFGSYWGGIYLTELDPGTGKLLTSPPVVTNIAKRAATVTGNPPIEGPYIYRHGGYHYLFVSYDRCCRGAASTYSIRVGRSATGPQGPYYDQAGVPMLDGGATTVLASHGYIRGPGGQSVVHDHFTGQDLLVYHYYHRDLDGRAFLGINELSWAGGWPQVLETAAPVTGG